MTSGVRQEKRLVKKNRMVGERSVGAEGDRVIYAEGYLFRGGYRVGAPIFSPTQLSAPLNSPLLAHFP